MQKINIGINKLFVYLINILYHIYLTNLQQKKLTLKTKANFTTCFLGVLTNHKSFLLIKLFYLIAVCFCNMMIDA